MDRTLDDNSVTTDSAISVRLAPQATQAAEGSGAGGGGGGRDRRGSGSNGDGRDTRLRKQAKLRKRANTLLPATVVRAEFDASSSDIWMGMVAGEATQPSNTPRGNQTASDIWTGTLLGERGVSGRSDAGGGDGGGGRGGRGGGSRGLGDDLAAGVLRSGGAVVASRAAGYLNPTIELVQTSAPFYNVSAALRYNNFVVLGSTWDVGLLICDVELISGAGREK